MAEVIEIDVSSPSSNPNGGAPLKPIVTLKHRDEIKLSEENEDCFILEFDPFDEIDTSKLPSPNDSDLCVIAEKGQVACRDYPHPRHTCAEHPFETTPHESHCDMCYCYVCDSPAPCEKWVGSSGHCHAYDNGSWEMEKKASKLLLKEETTDGAQLVSIID